MDAPGRFHHIYNRAARRQILFADRRDYRYFLMLLACAVRRGELVIQGYCFTLGTKLRALYQRKRGRDLFDLARGLDQIGIDLDRLVVAFEAYMVHGGTSTTRAQFEANMAAKMADAAFLGDVIPLLRPGSAYDPHAAWPRVRDAIVARLPGEPWKGAGGSP